MCHIKLDYNMIQVQPLVTNQCSEMKHVDCMTKKLKAINYET